LIAKLKLVIAVALAIVFSTVVNADDHRARINYTIHCQGCHLADASGLDGEVPRMNSFVGYFLHSKEGREFVIRVPGVATSSLEDDELTEMMNWLLLNFSAQELPDPFVPFSTEEVAALRPKREEQPQKTRIRILQRIAESLPDLASDLDAENGR
jgi:hypothetical protein